LTVGVCVIGASGYTGGELLRILLQHPKVEIRYLGSRTYKGRFLHQVHPHLRGFGLYRFSDSDVEAIPSSCDVVFLATPIEASLKLARPLIGRGMKIIDLSPAFRLKNPGDYERWYGIKHPHPEMLRYSVYGLPELHREEIRGADLVSCPGCIAAAATLALAPLAKEGLVDPNHIIIDAKMGSSGSGSRPSRGSIHAERFGVIRPYRPVEHRHTAEIEQELSSLSGRMVRVALSAHAVNNVRGILCTCHAYTLAAPLSVQELWRLYRKFYSNEVFIRLVRGERGLYRYPDPKMVIGSNFCDVGFEVDSHSSRIVAFAATDNLVKGASGSAVQCMNLIFGLEESLGLKVPPSYPV
jgi:N-acetyl-gamma-glutamyl-phosphate/LysW-gamma-L-alpha-aminoadipyl-6-phosphate reductase